MLRSYYIYQLIFPNEKQYIGQTVNIQSRWAQHQNRNNVSLVSDAIRLFGWDNIQKNIIDECIAKNVAFVSEQHYIDMYRTRYKSYGYNVKNAKGPMVYSIDSIDEMNYATCCISLPDVLRIIFDIQTEFMNTGNKQFIVPMTYRIISEKSGIDIGNLHRMLKNVSINSPIGDIAISDIMSCPVSRNHPTISRFYVQAIIKDIELSHGHLAINKINQILKEKYQLFIDDKTIYKYKYTC